MKKLLFLFFAFFALASTGQNAAPSGTLSLIPSPSTYYRAADSTVWDYKGTPYIWNRRLTGKDFSVLNTNYLIKWSGSSLVKSILFDNGTNIGVGTASPTVKLEVIGDLNSGFGSSSTRVVGIGLDGSFTTGKTGIFRFADTFNQLETTFNGTMIGRSYHGWQFYTAYGEVARFGTGNASLDSYFNGKVIFNSNVGIGTSTPNEMLTVGGRMFSGWLNSGISISASVGNSSSDSNPDIDLRRWAGSATIHGTARMSADASGNLIFFNHQQSTNALATAEHMRVTGSGNLGVGTINPSDKLEVTGNIRQTWASSVYNWMIYDDNFRQGIQYDGTNRILNLFSASGDTGGDIAFKTRLGAGSSSSDIGTEKVRIKASGFVGVGYTSDPGTTNLFAVNGNSYLNGNLTVQSTGYGVGKVLTSDANGRLNYTMPTGGTVTSVAALTVGTTGTDLSSTVATGTTTPVITLNVPTASAANRGALSAADWSTFNGKLSTLTGALLATGATTGATSQSQAFTIGITTPIHMGGTTTTSPLTLQTTSGVGATGADMHLKVGNNGSIEGLTILNNGNVGVRSTNPLYGLQVGNQLQLITNTDYVSGSAGSGLFIGLDAASGSTHGFMRAFTGGSSVNLGDINIQPTGGKTVFGHNNTARAIVDLKGGTAAAWSAPLKINAGTLMTATEAGAVENDTITHHLYFTPVAGSARVQLDNSAGGGTVTSVSVTTANGISGTVATATTTPGITLSLGAITPTSVNGAGISTNGNFSGTQNLWIGGGGASASGTGNVSVGYNAGTTNTTGGTNTFIGASAGSNITTGYSNVAIGSSALQGSSPYSAYGNCAIGLGALTALTTGNNNIAIGNQAGYGVNGSFSTYNLTSTTSLYIGSSTTPSANGNTNEVVIGNAANGNGSNTATIGNASITNTYIRGLTYDYIAVTTTYTVLMTDHIVNCGGTTAYTITLPSAVTAGAGREFILKRTSTVAGTITIAPVSSQTIDGTAGNNTTLLGTNYNKVHLVSSGTNWLTL